MVQHDMIEDLNDVQLSDHDNDTDDIPENFDLAKRSRKGDAFKTIGEFMQEQADMQMEQT